MTEHERDKQLIDLTELEFRKLSPKSGDVIAVEIPKNTSQAIRASICKSIRKILPLGVKSIVFEKGTKVDLIKRPADSFLMWPSLDGEEDVRK